MDIKMNYEQAIEKSLTEKWKIGVCSQGEECWCRVIRCEPPLMFREREDSDSEEYYVVRSGELNKSTAEHIVKLQNEDLNK
jgi:hypothetical protein